MKNVISYSLWGNNPLYTKGAVRNAQRSGEFYPGWVCRFYHDDSVPEDVIKAIQDAGSETRLMGKTIDVLGMYWRFHAMFDDPEIDRILVRDTDSFFTSREAWAVNDWIETGRPFHVIRDKEVHTVHILGGTWGAIAGSIPDFQKRMHVWFQHLQPMAGNPRGLFHGTDQMFLGHMIWPLIKDNHIAHVRAGMSELRYAETDRDLPPIEQDNGHFVGMPY